jgi:outer membrane autotransporter protein
MGSDSTALSDGRRMWARAESRHDSGLRMAEGHVRVKTDSTMLQLGGELVRSAVGTDAALYAGVMAGYGDASTRSTSTMYAPGSGQSSKVRSRGKVSGFSLGVYGTLYQNDSTRLGAYGDAWLQYGRYSNRISSELGSESYRSNLWSASIESGYAFMPFSADSALGNVVVEPNAQVIYNHYDAKDATLAGTRLRSGKDNTVDTRVGVRLYPHAKPGTDQPSLLPFVEANWLYSGDTASVKMGTNTLNALPSRNALELKVGVQGQVSQNIAVSAHLFGQTGNHSQRGYGGMLKLGYSW